MRMTSQEVKLLKSRIKQELADGKSKQIIYDELIEVYADRNSIASILDDSVSLKNREKYKGLNTILLISLSILGFIDVASLNFIATILDILLIVCVYKFNVKYYSWISVRGFFSVLVVALSILFNKDIDWSDATVIAAVIVTALLIIISFVLGLYLSNKLSPDFVIEKEMYVNEDGENRLRIKHVFSD